MVFLLRTLTLYGWCFTFSVEGSSNFFALDSGVFVVSHLHVSQACIVNYIGLITDIIIIAVD